MISLPDTDVLHHETLCYICCKFYENSELTPIFNKEGLNEKLSEKICKYTPFTVNSTSHPLALICTSCAVNINNWDNYVKSCIDAHCAFALDGGLERSTIVKSKTLSSTLVRPVQHTNCTEQAQVNVAESNASRVKKCNDKSRNTYCIAKWCSNNTGTSNISFFRIPKDKQRSTHWLINAGRQDLLHKDLKIIHSKYLCEKHFSDIMFMNEKHKRLVWNALPSIFPDTSTTHCFMSHKGTKTCENWEN